ncbi:MAG: sensor histidine kinase [Solirubrobacterales bacterium]
MELLIEITTDVIEALILLSMFQVFMDEKKYFIENKIRTVVFSILFTTVICWSSINVNLTNHVFLNSIFTIILLVFITNINIFSAIIVYFIFSTLILITEMSVGILGMLLLNVNIQQIVSNPNYLLIFTIITKLLEIIVVLLLFKFNLSIKKFKLFSKNNTVYHNFIFSIGTLGILTFAISSGFYGIKNILVYNIVVFALYITFSIISIMDINEKEKLLNIKNKYQVQEFNMKNMEQIISIIRKEKHDYANHINVIKALCTSNKPNTIEKIEEYVSEISNSIHNSFKYLNTGNDYIDGLLSIKSNYALENGIDFQVDIDDSLSNLKVKSSELISIISNLIDNAFEAFDENLVYNQKEVFFDSCLHDDKYIIEIGNNAEKIPKDIIENIFKKGFSTKKDKKVDHGFGLAIVKELVAKNHGIIKVESDEFETIFTIIFDLSKS